MYAAFAALALVAVGAEPFDREALCKAIPLPQVELMQLQITNGTVVVPDVDPCLSDEIAGVEKRLRADPENAGLYLGLQDLYERANDETKAKVAKNKAAELCRARLISHPEDGLARARLASCQSED